MKPQNYIRPFLKMGWLLRVGGWGKSLVGFNVPASSFAGQAVIFRQESQIELDPYYVELDIHNPYTLETRPEKIPMFLPHELLGAVWQAGCFTQLCGEN